MLEKKVRKIEQMLSVIDGPLTDAARIEMGLGRIVVYFRAAIAQQRRINRCLYTKKRRLIRPVGFALDQGCALCEAHFLVICWDSIYKVVENLRRNAYGIVTPREVLRRHRETLERFRKARDHMEHLPERFPGQSRSDWKGDANRVTGTVAGVGRAGFLVFQGEEWDVGRGNIQQLSEIVTELVDGCLAEVTSRHKGFLRGESAMRARRA
jgi:hypothetical protein